MERAVSSNPEKILDTPPGSPLEFDDFCYQCPPNVAWAVEQKGILVVDRNLGVILHLDYPQAAVWDLINRGYAFDQTLQMLCAIASLNTADAEQLILQCLDVWTRSGFLTRRDENG